MSRASIHNKLHYYLALIIAFSLPFGQFTPLLIVLFIANWLMEGNILNKIKIAFSNKYAVAFIIFYIIHILGLLYTQNIKSGQFDIQVKLSLLIFPLLLSSKPLIQKEISGVISALILGAFYASLYMLSRAVSLYITTGENAFFYESFSVLLHPSYFSMYLNVTIACLLINNVSNNIYFKKISWFTTLPLIVFFSLIIILLTSKSGIILLFFILSAFLMHMVIFQKKHLVGLILTTCLALSIALVYNFAPKVILRLSYLISALKNEDNKTTNESTTTRILIWKAAQQVIGENLLVGVGTGDGKDSLMNEYKKRNMKHAYEGNLNAHNTFYQVFISLGIIGFSIFLINLIMPLIFSLKTSDYLYASFLFIIIFNFCFESMLETQAGVIFYAFFNSIFCFKKSENNQVLTTLYN